MRQDFANTLVNGVLRFTEANFAFAAWFSIGAAGRRKSVQRRSSPLQNGDQAIARGALEMTIYEIHL